MSTLAEILPGDAFLILGAWVVLGFMLVGVGALVCRVIRAQVRDADGLLDSFWIGWAGLLYGLQLWHVFLPVDVRALLGAAALGLIGLGVSGVRPWQAALRGARGSWVLVVTIVLAALWIANRALAGPEFGDAGLYHIPMVRWVAEFPVVVGLGNLYEPFAYNQSYFLYVAMLDVGPFAERSYHLANGMLLLVLSSRALVGLHRLLRWHRQLAPVDAFYAFCLPAAAQLALGVFLTTPSPDLPIFALGIVLSGRLVAIVSRQAGPRAPDADLLKIALLATAALTVKLSIAGFVVVLVPLALVLVARRERPTRRSLVRTMVAMTVIGAAGLIPWTVRNVVLSGCPFFPSLVGALPVAWRVGADAPGTTIYSRSQAWQSYVHVALWAGLRDPRWLITKLASLGWNAREVWLPLAVALVAGVLAVLRWALERRRRSRGESGGSLVPLLLPPIGWMWFCLSTVALARFAGAAFWLLAVQCLLLAMGTGGFAAGSRRRLAASLAVLTLAAVPFFDARRGPVLLRVRGMAGMPRANVREVRLESGLMVNVPIDSKCFTAPLPCTPEPRPALRLRKPGALGAGFLLDPAVEVEVPDDPPSRGGPVRGG